MIFEHISMSRSGLKKIRVKILTEHKVMILRIFFQIIFLNAIYRGNSPLTPLNVRFPETNVLDRCTSSSSGKLQ